MSMSDIKIPRGTLAELRGVLVRALSRENLSVSDKMAIRKSQSSSSLKIHYTWNSTYGGGKRTTFVQADSGGSQTKIIPRVVSVYSDVVAD